MKSFIPVFKEKIKTPEDRSQVFVASRRDFLKIGSLATGGFLLGVNFQCSGPKGELMTFAPNVYISFNSDNEVTLIAHRSEMGTGIRTSLPMIMADELGADWSKIKIVQAEGDEDKYGNQNTDGSFSVRMFFEPMRKQVPLPVTCSSKPQQQSGVLILQSATPKTRKCTRRKAAKSQVRRLGGGFVGDATT
jgi:isoquinoline 1-oxidoreductase subunit beta